MTTQPIAIIANRKRWYLLSTLLILPGLISLAIWHLNVGIDFRGGSLEELSFSNPPAIEQVRTELQGSGIPGIQVQTSGSTHILVRFPNQAGTKQGDNEKEILTTLQKTHSDVKELSFQSIGGSVASSTTKNAAWAVAITSVAIILFIAWSFRGVSKPASSWRFGVTAILALAHDILFVIGAFSLIGHFQPSVEVDALFITAILTILGFSVNDTIVVFDRIRENLRRHPGQNFAEVTNMSLNQTLARSINTSSTVLIVLLALLLIGGESIRNFILALSLGVAIGTYSSIFNASPLLVSWQLWADKRTKTERQK